MGESANHTILGMMITLVRGSSLEQAPSPRMEEFDGNER